MNQGWIGAWSPGIGDPGWGGWVTVALYALAAWGCHQVLRSESRRGVYLSDNERTIWRLFMWGMIALGINKQLDLQSALIEMARWHANHNGWYGDRRQFQEAFVAAMPVLGVTALAALALLVWRAPTGTLWTCAGMAGLLVFVTIRATSFHQVDDMLGRQYAGLSLNWILEMGSLAVITFGARRRILVRS